MAQQLPPLPPQNDEYWQEADKVTTNLERVREEACLEHKLDILQSEMELRCVNCGYGGKYRNGDITIEDSDIYNRTGKKIGQLNKVQL